ncbi:hypothetical protein HMPREF3212_01871 [Citrobacter freundii]|nr:hypothetical protein HMPREF3212_01871 [Citrobacter freundii]
MFLKTSQKDIPRHTYFPPRLISFCRTRILFLTLTRTLKIK